MLIEDLIFPSTDNAVYIQWFIALIIWTVVLYLIRKINKDIKMFVYGLFVMNLAWFAARAIH